MNESDAQSNTQKLQNSLGYQFKDKVLLIEALTHKSYWFENPQTSPAHNERLEFLGDSVLALVVVDYLYRANIRSSEAEMSKIKSQAVKGTMLSEIAKELSLGDYVLLGKGEEDSGGRSKQSILANALEAVIGAIYVDSGIESAFQFVRRLLSGRLNAMSESGDYHDYKSELQELCQMNYKALPEYTIKAEEGSEHEKRFLVEVSVQGRPAGTGAGKSKKQAQIEAARAALAMLRSTA